MIGIICVDCEKLIRSGGRCKSIYNKFREMRMAAKRVKLCCVTIDITENISNILLDFHVGCTPPIILETADMIDIEALSKSEIR